MSEQGQADLINRGNFRFFFALRKCLHVHGHRHAIKEEKRNSFARWIHVYGRAINFEPGITFGRKRLSHFVDTTPTWKGCGSFIESDLLSATSTFSSAIPELVSLHFRTKWLNQFFGRDEVVSRWGMFEKNDDRDVHNTFESCSSSEKETTFWVSSQTFEKCRFQASPTLWHPKASQNPKDARSARNLHGKQNQLSLILVDIFLGAFCSKNLPKPENETHKTPRMFVKFGKKRKIDE